MATIININPPKIILMSVFYYLPEHPLLIQEFSWSYEDRIPEIPRTRKFLAYWQKNIDGQIKEIILSGLNSNGGSTKFRTVDEIFAL